MGLLSTPPPPGPAALPLALVAVSYSSAVPANTIRPTATENQAPPTHMRAMMGGSPRAELMTRWRSMTPSLPLNEGLQDLPGGVGGGGNAAKATLAIAEGEEGLVHFGRAEAGPVDGGGVVFGVGPLPEKEVGEAHLAGGANDEVRVGEAVAIEIGAEELLVDLLRGDAIGYQAGDRVADLRPAAVVEGYADQHAVVALGEVDSLLDLSLQAGREAVEAAQVAQPDARLGQMPGLPPDSLAEQAQEGIHLFLRAGPVLGGEGEEGQAADAVVMKALNDRPYIPGAGPVALVPGQSPRLGPTAVAIHDDSYMGGQP